MNARLVTTRRKPKLMAWTGLFFALCLMAYLATSFFLRSYNVSLSVEVQNTTSKVAFLQDSNKALIKEVQSLSDFNRVMAIAKAAGLTINNDNVIQLSKDE
jgi:cell division protein FtsL